MLSGKQSPMLPRKEYAASVLARYKAVTFVSANEGPMHGCFPKRSTLQVLSRSLRLSPSESHILKTVSQERCPSDGGSRHIAADVRLAKAPGAARLSLFHAGLLPQKQYAASLLVDVTMAKSLRSSYMGLCKVTPVILHGVV